MTPPVPPLPRPTPRHLQLAARAAVFGLALAVLFAGPEPVASTPSTQRPASVLAGLGAGRHADGDPSAETTSAPLRGAPRQLETHRTRRLRPALVDRPASGPVSSPFGWRRHPVSGRTRHHDGADLDGPARYHRPGRGLWRRPLRRPPVRVRTRRRDRPRDGARVAPRPDPLRPPLFDGPRAPARHPGRARPARRGERRGARTGRRLDRATPPLRGPRRLRATARSGPLPRRGDSSSADGRMALASYVFVRTKTPDGPAGPPHQDRALGPHSLCRHRQAQGVE